MKEKSTNNNYLENIPVRSSYILWEKDENEIVTLKIENTGFFNRIAQKVFRKPKYSYIHLDELGSFVWPMIDGKKSILELGDFVKKHFGEKAEPLYERLAKFFQVLHSYNFISLK